MIFKVIPRLSRPPSSESDTAYLEQDRWNDYGYQTMFYLVLFDSAGTRHEAGQVKIGQRGLSSVREAGPGKRAPQLASEFKEIGGDYFSLGQDDNYYEVLSQLPHGMGAEVLRALRDCAFDLSIFDSTLHEDVMDVSLLRFVRAEHVRQRFHRLAHGNAALSEFHFQYVFATHGNTSSPPVISFHVLPQSEPPTNVHVLIGRNGVGKTRCFQNLAKALLTEAPDPLSTGVIAALDGNPEGLALSGLVAVTFSAFDRFEIPQVTAPKMHGQLVGLHNQSMMLSGSSQETGSDPAIEPTKAQFANVFCDSLARCRTGPRRERLLSAIETLENDPLFAEEDAKSLLSLADDEWQSHAKQLFIDLSSGHAVILLTMTRLVELVDEKTIVLIDEPEGHLHPPLLSAFVRALSDLLSQRNGLAIIATHSPVVLQEVPRSCVWLLQRSGGVATVDKPSIETFGENVGTLTREVFGLEVTHTGFYRMLSEAADDPHLDYDGVLAKFDRQLGAEAKALVRALVAERSNGERHT